MTEAEDVIDDLTNMILTLSRKVEAQSEVIRLMRDELQLVGDVADANQDDINRIRAVLRRLEDRNEYGLSESEARFVHDSLDVLLGRGETPFRPWPQCHCQLSPDASSMAPALHFKSGGVDVATVD